MVPRFGVSVVVFFAGADSDAWSTHQSVQLASDHGDPYRRGIVGMRMHVPPRALAAGLSNEPAGTHTSRTIMLDELGVLLASCRADATYEDYATAIVDANVLRKATLSTRKKSLRHLRELYALRADVPVFAALRGLWGDDPPARPLLAVLCAAARDPLLRCTAEVVADTSPGSTVQAVQFADAVEAVFPHRFGPGVRARIGRNAASSWTQSGHLRGRVRKVRVHAKATPASAAYALYLGHLCDETGNSLFRTNWAKLLDVSEHDARDLAAAASRLGWIAYRSAAGMTEVTFRHLEAIDGHVVEVPA